MTTSMMWCKKCLKILSGRRGADSYSDLNISILDQIYECFCLIRLFKYYVVGTGIYFNEKFSEAETNYKFRTRIVTDENLIHPNVPTSEILTSIFFLISLAFWNKLPVSAKNNYSLSCFKRYLRNRYFWINR